MMEEEKDGASLKPKETDKVLYEREEKKVRIFKKSHE
jgi:hypothetical protein